MTQESIIEKIEEHLAKSPKPYYSDFYIGITNDINERLFDFHQVDKQNDWWIHCKADTEEICRDVEKHFIELGMDGGPGGGNPEIPPTHVYCYEINEHTKQR